MKKSAKNSLKRRLFLALFSLFFVFSTLFSFFSAPVFADPKPTTTTETTSDSEKPKSTETTETAEESSSSDEKTEEKSKITDEDLENICNDQSGALGWLICPSSGAISKAVDSIYGTIEDFLVINPIPADDSSTIHIVWDYVKGVTNIVFIIFLLVVVISHLTGFGTANYHWRRILPRVIIVGILINLSFIICQLAVDVSNLLGYGLRDLFLSVEENAILNGSIKNVTITWTDLVNVVTGAATAAGIGIALSGGLVAVFWTLVPVLLGAIVSIAIGFITIAMRQALVAVLVMISPLAFVCFLLPNTEKWFSKWKDTLFRMLVFYPAFSFLFGASHLAGWAIITSSIKENGETSGFGVLLGLAVQVFPLFFSWSLMKMSGSVLGIVNQKLHALSQKPLGALSRASLVNKELAKSKYLATKPKGLGQDIMQRINDRQIRTEEDIAKYTAHSKLRGQAYAARMRNKKGDYTKRAEEFYEMQADAMTYQRQIERTKGDFNKGLGAITEADVARGKLDRATLKSARFIRLQQLDLKNVEAADTLKFEQARSEKIDYDNAVGFHDRVEQAFDAETDRLEAKKDQEAIKAGGKAKHQYHTYLDYGSLRNTGLSRYETIKEIMEGDVVGTLYTKADAAHSYATQAKIVAGKFQTAFDLTPATQDVENQIRQLASDTNSTKNIDQVIAGLRTINMRGDTDIVKRLIDETLAGGKIQLGTHASQALANFCMFEVKDSDPLLRRFGKYINLETAAVYNDKEDPTKVRLQKDLTFDEYILGEYENPDRTISKSKRNAKKLLEGTSLDNVERTFYNNLDQSVQKAIMSKYGKTQVVDDKGIQHDVLTEDGVKAFAKMRNGIYDAMGPAFIGASLKYPSGSEQLVSAVSYMTGLTLEGDGSLTERWKKADDPLYGLGEEYFREKTENYLKDQIPNQILNMRTDYRESLTEHLLGSLFADNENHAVDKANYEAALAAINSDPNLDDNGKKKARKQLRIDTAGIKAREIWEQNGTLGQLYKSRRSGAANNAKPFVRTWANLDNEAEIIAYLKKQAKEEREKRRAAGEPDIDAGGDPISIYSERDRIAYQTKIDEMYSSIGNNPENFYKKTRKYILNKLDLSYIASEYENYYKNNRHASAADLADYLKQLLDDEENYPSY